MFYKSPGEIGVGGIKIEAEKYSWKNDILFSLFLLSLVIALVAVLLKVSGLGGQFIEFIATDL